MTESPPPTDNKFFSLDKKREYFVLPEDGKYRMIAMRSASDTSHGTVAIFERMEIGKAFKRVGVLYSVTLVVRRRLFLLFKKGVSRLVL